MEKQHPPSEQKFQLYSNNDDQHNDDDNNDVDDLKIQCQNPLEFVAPLLKSIELALAKLQVCLSFGVR